MARFKVNVTVQGDGKEAFAQALKECQAAGMAVERQLSGVGVITGEVDAAQAAALGKIEGVRVERARTFQAKPPGHGPV